MNSSHNPSGREQSGPTAWSPEDFGGSLNFPSESDRFPEMSLAQEAGLPGIKEFESYLTSRMMVDSAPVKESSVRPAVTSMSWDPPTLSFSGILAGANADEEDDSSEANWQNSLNEMEQQAQRIIKAAQKEAEQIVEEARAQAMEESSKVLDEAYRQGWELGKKEAHSLLTAARDTVEQAAGWAEQVYAQGESTVIEMVKEMASCMFGGGIVLDRDVMQKSFHQVLERAKSLGDLKIYMNPEDATVLGPDWRDMETNFLGKPVHIIASRDVQRGGCFVEGQMGSADALVSTRLKRLTNALDEAKTEEVIE